ncbi:hypothetical protein HpCHC45_04010 [Helicobacter pylori]
MVTHARVFSLKPKFEISHKIGLFLSTLFFDYSKKFGYENMCSWAKIKNDKVILPLKPTAKTQSLEDIDFHYHVHPYKRPNETNHSRRGPIHQR